MTVATISASERAAQYRHSTGTVLCKHSRPQQIEYQMFNHKGGTGGYVFSFLCVYRRHRNAF